MKKRVFWSISVAAFVAAVVFNVSIALRSDSSSDLALANIEALVFGETSDQFTQQTCCEACIEKKYCSGCDGRTHSVMPSRNNFYKN